MTSFELVLALVRNALWGDKIPSLWLSDEKWEKIYKIASDQALLSIIFDAFNSECVPPKTILSRWTLDVSRCESVAERINNVQEELSSYLDKNGIEYAILKGVNIAKFYPDPKHRIAGDIDFYFPSANGFAMANRMAKRLSEIKLDSDGDIHYVRFGIVVEHHRGWNHLSSKAASNMQARIQDHSLIPEDDLLMLSSHLLRHAMTGGAGLRQLMDVAVATRAYHGQYRKAAFAGRLTELGLEKWGGLLAAVMNTAFKIPVKELPVEPDKTYLDDFMALVFSDGNLGKSNDHSLSRFYKRFHLFIKLCPQEYFARWFSLISGRTRRIFEKLLLFTNFS